MSPVRDIAWYEANQQVLEAALAVVKAVVRQKAVASGMQEAGETSALLHARAELEAARAGLDEPASLDQLCMIFNLSPFERDPAVALCGG